MNKSFVALEEQEWHLHPVQVERPLFGPLLRLPKGLAVHLRGARLGQAELNQVRERPLLQLVSVQGQELLEVPPHTVVLQTESGRVFLIPYEPQ